MGIATRYGLDGPGSNSGRGEIYASVHAGPAALRAS